MLRARLRARVVLACSLVAGCVLATVGIGTVAGASVARSAPAGGYATAAGGTYGGTLSVVTAAGPWVSLDPNNPVEPPGTANEFPWVESLFQPSSNGSPTPWLATGFKASGGGLVVTLTLRKGIEFQDGTPFNAAAVQWNLKNYASTTIDSECVTYYAGLITSVTTPSNYTVVINMSAPDAGLQSYMTTLDCGDMVSPTAYQADGPAAFANNPVGTGPFKYTGGTPTETADFVRFNGYWGGRPHLAGVNFTALSNDMSALDELENGSAQVWFGEGQDVAAQVGANKSLQSRSALAASINYVTFSVTHPPFNNPLAREAVFYATNSKQIRQELYGNFYPAVEGVLPPSMLGYTPTVKGYPAYNLQKAQALVQQLGGLKFTLNEANTPVGETEGAALQAQFQAAGMTVTLNPLQTTAFLGALHAHTFDSLLVSSIAYSDPDPLMYRFFYSGSPLSQLGLLNGQTSLDPTLDQDIIMGRSVYGTKTRTAIYEKANQRVVNPDYEWDDIYAATTRNVQTKKVLNLNPSPFGKYNWANVELKK